VTTSLCFSLELSVVWIAALLYSSALVITYVPTYPTAHEHCLSNLSSLTTYLSPCHTIPIHTLPTIQPAYSAPPAPESNNNVLLNPYPLLPQQQQQQTAHPPPQQLNVSVRLLLHLRRNARLKLRFFVAGLLALTFRSKSRECGQGEGQREGSCGGCSAEEGEFVG
jgi:hypothetical protein